MTDAEVLPRAAAGIGRWTAALSAALFLRALGFGAIVLAARELRDLALDDDLSFGEAIGRVFQAIAVYVWAGLASVVSGVFVIVLLIFWFRRLRDRHAGIAAIPLDIGMAVTRSVVPGFNAIFAPSVLAALERAVWGRDAAPLSTLWRITALATLVADLGTTVFLMTENDSSQDGLGRVALWLAIGAAANGLLAVVSALYVILVGRRAALSQSMLG